jgi:hypothetical protein
MMQGGNVKANQKRMVVLLLVAGILGGLIALRVKWVRERDAVLATQQEFFISSRIASLARSTAVLERLRASDVEGARAVLRVWVSHDLDVVRSFTNTPLSGKQLRIIERAKGMADGAGGP